MILSLPVKLSQCLHAMLVKSRKQQYLRKDILDSLVHSSTIYPLEMEENRTNQLQKYVVGRIACRNSNTNVLQLAE